MAISVRLLSITTTGIRLIRQDRTTRATPNLARAIPPNENGAAPSEPRR